MQEQDHFQTQEPLETVGATEDAVDSAETEAVVSDTEETLAQEFQAEADEGDVEAAQSEDPKHKKLFTLSFCLPLEDYIDFYRLMSAENVQKGRKKMTIVGIVGIGVGLILVLSAVLGYTHATPVSWFLLAIIFLFGFRCLFYYKFFYEKALVKAVTREYNKYSHLRERMQIDFYPNKCVEHIQNQEVETYWHTIHSVKESVGLFMIMLEPRRCLLIPKSQIKPQLDALEKFIGEICENYEKPRYQV